jgi:predicted SprT family Zn-dependent metalloprotease
MDPKCEQAGELALRLMQQFGLAGWGFAFNRRKTQMGRCIWPHLGMPGRIELSAYFIELNAWSEVEDTIRHEIAHALAGHKAGHGPRWVAMCKVTGARPQRCTTKPMPKGRWRARCPSCNKEFHKHRRPKQVTGWHCVACGPERGRVTWVKHAGR